LLIKWCEKPSDFCCCGVHISFMNLLLLHRENMRLQLDTKGFDGISLFVSSDSSDSLTGSAVIKWKESSWKSQSRRGGQKIYLKACLLVTFVLVTARMLCLKWCKKIIFTFDQAWPVETCNMSLKQQKPLFSSFLTANFVLPKTILNAMHQNKYFL